MTRALEYGAYQSLGDVAGDPDLVAELILTYVQLMLERVVEDGHNPADGVLKVVPVLYVAQQELSITWTPL